MKMKTGFGWVPVGVQLAGAAAGITGLVILFGVGWALLIGGTGLTVVGALREAGRI